MFGPLARLCKDPGQRPQDTDSTPLSDGKADLPPPTHPQLPAFQAPLMYQLLDGGTPIRLGSVGAAVLLMVIVEGAPLVPGWEALDMSPPPAAPHGFLTIPGDPSLHSGGQSLVTTRILKKRAETVFFALKTRSPDHTFI